MNSVFFFKFNKPFNARKKEGEKEKEINKEKRHRATVAFFWTCFSSC